MHRDLSYTLHSQIQSFSSERWQTAAAMSQCHSFCVEFACSPCVPQGSLKSWLLFYLPLASWGAWWSRKETSWNNVFLAFHALRSGRESPSCHVKRKQLGLLMHRRKHEISPLLPQVRGSVAPRIRLDKWHRVKKIGVTKSWDKNRRRENSRSTSSQHVCTEASSAQHSTSRCVLPLN